MSEENQQRFLNTREAAVKLGFDNAAAARELIKQGLLEGEKHGRRYVTTVEAVEAFVARVGRPDDMAGQPVSAEQELPVEAGSGRENAMTRLDWSFLALLLALLHAFLESLLQGSLALAQGMSVFIGALLWLFYLLLTALLLLLIRRAWRSYQLGAGQQ